MYKVAVPVELGNSSSIMCRVVRAARMPWSSALYALQFLAEMGLEALMIVCGPSMIQLNEARDVMGS